jgi:hypothetical protein
MLDAMLRRLLPALLCVPLFSADAFLARVSSGSPFAAGCNGLQAGVNYRNAALEPWVAADPNDSRHLIGVWQQDRWSNGGASGVLTGVSFDGGQSWTTTSAHFSRCSGGTAENGGGYDRATDAWVTFSPDGSAYQIAYAFNRSNFAQAMLVSRSSDGGSTWSEPVTLIRDTARGIANDKESITADSTNPNYVYAVWDRLTGLNSDNPYDFRGPAWFARTVDGGVTWEPARIIYDPGPNAQTIGNQLLSLPDGSLLDVFTLIQNAWAPMLNDEVLSVAVIRSADQGASWSDPVIVAANQAIGVANVKTGKPLRTGVALAASAVDPVSGAVYIAWQDARFSGAQREGIAFSKSLDGGLTWSDAAQVNQVPDVQAFNPSIAAKDGTVAIAYYDFRQDTDDRASLWTSYWRVTSADGGASWSETTVAGPFDLSFAPSAGAAGLFVGDYQGLAASRNSFLSFFAATNAGGDGNATDVFAVYGDTSGDVSTNGHQEINLHRLRMREHTPAGERRIHPRQLRRR